MQTGISLLTADDIYLFNEGNHFRLYEKLGAHPAVHEGRTGIYFAVWAPNAQHVGVMGSFNDWNKDIASPFPGQLRHLAWFHSGIGSGTALQVPCPLAL